MSKPKNTQGTPRQKCGACGGRGEKLIYDDGFELDCCPECSANIATDRIAAGAYAYTAAAIGAHIGMLSRFYKSLPLPTADSREPIASRDDLRKLSRIHQLLLEASRVANTVGRQ